MSAVNGGGLLECHDVGRIFRVVFVFNSRDLVRFYTRVLRLAESGSSL